MIFIFPKGGHTDWDKVRADGQHMEPGTASHPGKSPWRSMRSDFDGFYAWINPGEQGWKPDGSDWGEQYLTDFYRQ